MKENLSMNLKPIYESIISEGKHYSETIVEDKTSLIKNHLVLPDIEDPEEKEKFKATLVAFFKKHPNYENKIDWNKAKTLTRKDFDEVLSLEGSLSGEENAVSTEKSVLNIFKSVKGRKFKIVGENSRWLFVAPLNWKAAVYCDSAENQGAGAKWCIGQSTTRQYWDSYIFEKRSVFVMAFNKSYREMSEEELKNNLKYMIEKDVYDEYHVWSQENVDKGEDLRIVGENADVADKMFSKAKGALDASLMEQKRGANEKAEKILAGLKEIDEHTFDNEYKSLITDITIPDSVTSIGDGAFSECTSLTSIIIPESVTSIGKGAFSYCKKLTSITIPDSVTSIESSAFYNCLSLTSITIPNSVTSIEDFAFNVCKSLTSVTIPNSVTSIGDSAFSGCKSLVSITIPNSVTSIGSYAFYRCTSLTSITIPNSVTSIGVSAFANCTSLTSINIPDFVTSIGDEAFYNCNSNIVVTVSKDFNKKLLKRTSLPETARIRVVD